MKRMQRVTAAADGDSKLQDTVSDLKADFEYILDGLDKLERTSSDKANQALTVALELSSNLQDFTATIASAIRE